jgi:hypothetical protein
LVKDSKRSVLEHFEARADEHIQMIALKSLKHRGRPGRGRLALAEAELSEYLVSAVLKTGLISATPVATAYG